MDVPNKQNDTHFNADDLRNKKKTLDLTFNEN